MANRKKEHCVKRRSVSLTDEEWEWLQQAATELDVSASWIVRKLINQAKKGDPNE